MWQCISRGSWQYKVRPFSESNWRLVSANTVSLGYSELAAEIQVAALPRVETSSSELVKGFREFDFNPADEDRVRNELLEFYRKSSDKDADEDTEQKDVSNAESLVQGLQGPGLFLHDLYVRNNANKTKSKSLLDDAGDGSVYSAGHGELHPVMRSMKGGWICMTFCLLMRILETSCTA